jgi:hypothetical protein
MRGPLALALAALVLSAPLARAATPPAASVNDIPALKRTNQVLALVIAFLKLVDELAQLPDPGDGTPMPPPIGTGHPGPLPGPLPGIAPGEPMTELAVAG